MASERKTRLVSWGAFCVDEKVLPKTASPGTVVKLCDDRGLNNSIADGGPKKPQKNKSRLQKCCGEISAFRKSYNILLRRAKEKQMRKNEPSP